MLRRPVRAGRRTRAGPWRGAWSPPAGRYRERFITPMAAVAGAVADEMHRRRSATASAHGLRQQRRRHRAAPGAGRALRASAWSPIRSRDAARPPARRSTARSRSTRDCRCAASRRAAGADAASSLGIADSVTVLAASGAAADAAATMIANAVDVASPAIERRPRVRCRRQHRSRRPAGHGRRRRAAADDAVEAALANGAALAERLAAARTRSGAPCSRCKAATAWRVAFAPGSAQASGVYFRATTTTDGRQPCCADTSSPLPRPAALAAAFAAPARRRGRSRSASSTATRRFPAFLEPYKKGWELAVEEVNAAGGVLGRKIEVVSRDDNGNPGDAVRVAEELRHARERALHHRHLPVERRPGGHRLRQAEARCSSSPPSR